MSEELSAAATVVARQDLLDAEVSDETVVLDPESGTYYGTNAVGSAVWGLLEEPRTVAEIREAIREEFDVDRDRCERDLAAFLAALAENDLVDVHEDDPA